MSKSFRSLILRAGVIAVAAGAILIPVAAQAATYTSVSVTMSDSRPSTAAVTYTATVSNATATNVKCYKVAFNTASDGSGGKPTGMTIAASGVTSTLVSGIGGWTVASDNTAGSFTVSDATGATQSSSAGRTLAFGGITNGSTSLTGYFLIVSAYSNQGCTTPVDSGVTMFLFVDGQALTASVGYVETLSITGLGSSVTCNGATTTVDLSAQTNAVPFGTTTPGGSASIACQRFQFGTNASGGGSVYTWLTGAFSNGSHAISNGGLTTQAGGSPQTFPATGNEAFGYTTSAKATTSLNFANDNFSTNKWAAFGNAFAATEPVFASTLPTKTTVTSGSASNFAAGQFDVGYQLQTATYTPAGSYSTTAIFSAAPSF